MKIQFWNEENERKTESFCSKKELNEYVAHNDITHYVFDVDGYTHIIIGKR